MKIIGQIKCILGLDTKEFDRKLDESQRKVEDFSEETEDFGEESKTSFLSLSAFIAAVTSAAMIMVKWWKNTAQGAETVNIALGVTKQLINDIMMGQKFQLGKAVEIAKEQSQQQYDNVKETYEVKKMQSELNQLIIQAADKTKFHAEKLEVLTKAMEKEKEIKAFLLKDAKEELATAMKQWEANKLNLKVREKVYELAGKIKDIEGMGSWRLQSQFTAELEAQAQRAKDLFVAFTPLGTTIADLRAKLEDLKKQIEDTRGSEDARGRGLLEQIKITEDLIKKLTTLERKLISLESISGLRAPAVSAGFPAAPGIQPFGGTIATGAEINQRQIEAMTESLQEQQIAVGILSNAFDTLFTSTEDGFKAMVDSIIGGVKRLIAELLARAAILTFLNIITGGFAGALKGVLKGAAGSMFPGLTGKVAAGASGGTVPAGYPNDTFPMLASSGETLLTAQQSRDFNRNLYIHVTGEIAGRVIALQGRRTEEEN